MSEKLEQQSPPAVQVRRTLEGYTWTITINATDSSLTAMRSAVETAALVDDDLRERFKYQVAPTQRKG